ncbi:MAG: hypothetical protein H3C35_06235 [Bacteroidetes bacterium]|nr:hypothetical protein [Bacteroidota bacterium]
MKKSTQYLAAALLILLAAFSRLLPHPLNFTPVMAIALFGGMYFDKRFAVVIPFAALVLSDLFLGFYGEIFWVYGSFIAVAAIGMWLKNHKSVSMIAGTTLAGSILFFAVTNFGVWLSGYQTYPKTLEGLLACYTAAIPFFRNSLAGDFFYVAVLFGIFELSLRFSQKRVVVKA